MREIALYFKGESEPVWVVQDDTVPMPGDHVEVENADGSRTSGIVHSRSWVTAKQGESSFSRVRIFLKAAPEPGTKTTKTTF